MGFDGRVDPEVTEGAHRCRRLCTAMFDVVIVSEGVRDEVAEIFKMLGEREYASVREENRLCCC